MTTPTVMAIYKPLHRISTQTQLQLERKSTPAMNSQEEFRIIDCIHAPESVPSFINLVELIRNTKFSPLKLYIMHLVELTDPSSSIVMVQKARKNGFPFINRFRRGMSSDQIVVAFEEYSQLGRVIVRHSTAISAMSTMHEDIFHVAEDKRVSMIVLPFHKQYRRVEGEEVSDTAWHRWREVNWKVLQRAPCSVAVLVDRGFGSKSEKVAETTATMPKRICTVFFGGPDDRKALELGGRMAEHTEFKLTLVRFFEEVEVERNIISEQSPQEITCIENDNRFSRNEINYLKEKELDDAHVEAFRGKLNQSAVYEETVMRNITGQLLTIGKSKDYELVLVGKGRFPLNTEAKLANNQAENLELGPIGNILASTDDAIVSSVLVILNHRNDKVEASVSKMVAENFAITDAQESCV